MEVNRKRAITDSISEGHQIHAITIPTTHVLSGVVFYEVDLNNRKLRWNVFRRYEQFSNLHEQLYLKMQTEDFPLLPPFPGRHFKFWVDHLNPHFIEQRRVLLENYLQKLLAILEYREHRLVLEFLIPEDDDQFVPATKRNSNASGSGSQEEEKGKVEKEAEQPVEREREPSRSQVESKQRDTVWYDDDDDVDSEVSSVSIPAAQILRGDHVIYQINVVNEKKRKSFSQWTVLKRYGEFAEFDAALRSYLATQVSLSHLIPQLPPLPPKQLKLWVNHLDLLFIEQRRILLEHYLKTLIALPEVNRLRLTLRFLGV
eukprot:TRINITY_DN4190_c0_g1_i1.p1 TRINITY_DN4190_c0_g1~~TRINITY_DN4190_c0_g1_i1.p1  ORF type:complete len:315 (-),score=43.67 TRINITY_DN4190_c0_g1_i1:164-1108(-)